MPVTDTGVVVQEIVVAASAETIYGFLVDSEKVTRWMGRAAELDPTPGGIYRVEINDQAIMRGAFVELVPNERVVFTHGWEGEGQFVPAGSTTVEITLTPEGDRTRVRLEHRDLPAETRDDHGDGWTKYFARLAAIAEGRDPGPDPHA